MGKEIEEIEVVKEKHTFRIIFFLVLLIIILLIVYGFFLGNTGMIIKEYDIENSSIPTSFDNLKIAHFSDIIYKDTKDLEKVKNAVEKINDKKVDIVVFSGGLVDKNYKLNEKEMIQISTELKKINSTYGKYYVSGSDDKEIQVYDTIMQNGDFISLNDNIDIIYSKLKESILLVGVDYKSNLGFLNEKLKDKENMFKIVIFHESDEIDDLKNYNFNMALSGNSLNGQINIPIIKDILLPENSKNYYNPYYKVDNTDLYISSGIGTRKIDFRLFNKPSVNIYVFKKM